MELRGLAVARRCRRPGAIGQPSSGALSVFIACGTGATVSRLRFALDFVGTDTSAEYWVTRETKWTIYLVCLVAFAEGEDKEFLGLPITLKVRHPLRLSIGHKTHGKRMETMFVDPYPRGFRGTDVDFTKNNVLVETWISNQGKSSRNTDEECEVIKKHIRDVRLPKDLYNPDAVSLGQEVADPVTIQPEDLDADDDWIVDLDTQISVTAK